MFHSAFPNLPIIGKPLAGYMVDEDAGVKRIVMPEYVKAMSKRGRSRWMDERGIVPAVGGGAYSMFEMMQPFSVTDDVTVNIASETALTNDEYLTLPANFFSFPGKCAWFRCMGKTSSVITTPGTSVAKVRYSTPVAGGGIAGTQLTISGTLTPDGVAAHTDNVWWMDTFVKALNTGKLATSLAVLAWGYIYFASEIVPTTTALWASRFMPPGGTSLANISSLDGTVAKALTATITPSLTTFTWTVRDAYIVAMN